MRAPSVPSVPVPLRTTAIRRSPKFSAALLIKRSTEGLGRPAESTRRSISLSVTFACRFAGTTKITPALKGSWSVTVLTGSLVLRERISSRWLSRSGSRCWATTIGAGKSTGRFENSCESASMPPADEPTTTRCENESVPLSGNAPPTTHRVFATSDSSTRKRL